MLHQKLPDRARLREVAVVVSRYERNPNQRGVLGGQLLNELVEKYTGLSVLFGFTRIRDIAGPQKRYSAHDLSTERAAIAMSRGLFEIQFSLSRRWMSLRCIMQMGKPSLDRKRMGLCKLRAHVGNRHAPRLPQSIALARWAFWETAHHKVGQRAAPSE